MASREAGGKFEVYASPLGNDGLSATPALGAGRGRAHEALAKHLLVASLAACTWGRNYYIHFEVSCPGFCPRLMHILHRLASAIVAVVPHAHRLEVRARKEARVIEADAPHNALLGKRGETLV